ncbi:protein TolR [Legionella oakridgensis]|uniref:Tol-Pal system protein TolR n=2 Tax=Legionella oakridgensis TaxID=29423 RepID=W0BEE8_9GAMM|nr:protein TolR [Legionella oakridgensis]AHE67086.1 TolR protein [Legionella oakridgensis ATCC 33761 = DSM 21215]ETO93266.1 cell division and transport-associated protein TolR [Legionella oakridgensis RV-2-2007]KTD44454.1 biopolymer transport protein TolR [Legionella oakridgensis]STY20177.1 biopolymer transport protein TolR [Legionella longbeachae]
MMKKKGIRTRPIAEINVVPYIDVMLVLLVIFMITAPMLTQGVTVDLPKAASDTIKAAEREPIIVSVDRQGDYFLNISSTPDMPMAPQALMVRVAAELELARQSGKPINVLVKGDQGVPYGKVVIAMSLLKQAGAEQVGLITDSSELTQGDMA